MKRIAVLSAMLALGGLGAYGQTNVPPPIAKPAAPPQLQLPKTLPNKPLTPRDRTLTRTSETPPPQTGLFRRIMEQDLLKPSPRGKNYNIAMENIFESDNPQSGATVVRDTYITIFPTGR